ncbi:hypothetical protein SmJEL517_g00011 [Synchytrium microbalum]|uniref:MATE efflux family protein n=1 Tax=Synchytrium microbalum TaxID=1806994 RepID=A0A507C9G5_9FUNG|nr:uncharacterized protein SmJEL517_g00011 [Synchytrium microbalum]TPX38230.1 hypothetical protein SmJEL517_g00011 [Synchytrium microbalum]
MAYYGDTRQPPLYPVVDEYTPLLSEPPSYDLDLEISVSQEIWVVLKTFIPVSLTYALQNSLQTACVVIVGRLGADDLAAAAFAFMFAMVTGWVVAMGGSTALDTLGSQAFTGASDKTEVGVLLQRCLLILTVLFVPVVALWYFAEPLFLLLGQEPQLSARAALFLRYLLFGAPAYLYFESIKKYLQAQGIMHAGTYVMMVASPFNIILNYLLVWHPSCALGFIGAPIATSITYWLMLFLLILYVVFVDGSEAWGGFSRKAFTNWASFLALAVPGVLMVGTEWWAFELVAMAAGLLGPEALAAQSIIMTADQVLNTIPFGLSVSSSNRVGNLLGSRLPRRSKLAANVSAGVACTIGAGIMGDMLASKDVFGYLFTDDASVVILVAKVMPWVAAFQVADGLANSCGGSLRGMGRQHIGAIVNVSAYYLIALPCGLWLAFRANYGLEGLWMGQFLALSLVGLIELWIVTGTNWAEEVENCEKRLKEEEEEATSSLFGNPSAVL